MAAALALAACRSSSVPPSSDSPSTCERAGGGTQRQLVPSCLPARPPACPPARLPACTCRCTPPACAAQTLGLIGVQLHPAPWWPAHLAGRLGEIGVGVPHRLQAGLRGVGWGGVGGHEAQATRRATAAAVARRAAARLQLASQQPAAARASRPASPQCTACPPTTEQDSTARQLGRTMTMALPDWISALSTCPPRCRSPAAARGRSGRGGAVSAPARGQGRLWPVHAPGQPALQPQRPSGRSGPAATAAQQPQLPSSRSRSLQDGECRRKPPAPPPPTPHPPTHPHAHPPTHPHPTTTTQAPLVQQTSSHGTLCLQAHSTSALTGQEVEVEADHAQAEALELRGPEAHQAAAPAPQLKHHLGRGGWRVMGVGGLEGAAARGGGAQSGGRGAGARRRPPAAVVHAGLEACRAAPGPCLVLGDFAQRPAASVRGEQSTGECRCRLAACLLAWGGGAPRHASALRPAPLRQRAAAARPWLCPEAPERSCLATAQQPPQRAHSLVSVLLAHRAHPHRAKLPFNPDRVAAGQAGRRAGRQAGGDQRWGAGVGRVRSPLHACRERPPSAASQAAGAQAAARRGRTSREPHKMLGEGKLCMRSSLRSCGGRKGQGVDDGVGRGGRGERQQHAWMHRAPPTPAPTAP